MNPLSFSTVIQDDAQAPQRMAMIRDAGFDGVEPTFILSGSLPTAEDPIRSAERLKKLADQVGLKIPSMRGGPGFWTTFASSDPSQRDRAVQIAQAGMNVLKILGGDTLLIVPGKWEANQRYDQVWQNALETAKRIALIADRLGITVALENVENSFLVSPREWMQFLDEVNSPRVRMYFDAGNVVYLKLGHPEQWIRQLGLKYIARVHFKDASVGGPLTYLLEGAVNWPAVRDALVEIGYRDWIGIELATSTHHPQAMLAATCLAAKEILR